MAGIWRCRRRFRLTSIFLLLPFSFVCMFLIAFKPNDSFNSDTPDGVMVLRQTKTQKEYIDKRGIHVIVGHYVGNNLPWETTPNLTQEMLNSNGYAPFPNAGEMGQAVHVAPHEQSQMRALFHINRFNLMASDRISVNRSLQDVRKQGCKEKKYDAYNLPDTSIVIVFHNEAWSTLLRTIHSIINRSPPHLLREIILVDDASDREFLKEPLENYVAKLPLPVHIIRAENRTGLIRARLMGAHIAQGTTLTFLDAHCECTKGWLEPLLAHVSQDRKRVACPVIDIIHDETFQYIRSFELHWGAFNWELHFRWYPLGRSELEKRQNDTTKPFRTPVMAGGLFTIDRSYFEEIGSYDDQMDIWGGENIEISFRVWQCGGSIEIIPCSHVGHLFRRSSPYTFPRPGGVGGVLFRNLARVAEVWMDEWADFYFAINPGAKKMRNEIDVRLRKSIRKSLGCKSFKWYLDHIWMEHFLPTKERFFGKIRNRKTGKCFSRPNAKNGGRQPVGKVQLHDCAFELYPPQCYVYAREGFIMTDESVCLDAVETSPDSPVIMLACASHDRQKWRYDPVHHTVVHVRTKLCLDLPSERNPEGLTIQTCDGALSQQWSFESIEWTST